ncbi:MAG: hypothetical protein AAFO70_01780 [Pseudomonadota bacterium]
MLRIATLALAFAATPALAGPADEFLAGIDGKWRGGGTLSVGSDGKQTKVRCSLTNTLSGATLALDGNCASSAGKRALKGELTASGSNIRSSALTLPGAGILKSPSSRFSGDTLTITGSLDEGGRSVPIRNTLRRSGASLTLSVAARKDGGWQDRGTLTFRR